MEDHTKDMEAVSSIDSTIQPAGKVVTFQYPSNLPAIVVLTNIVVSLLSLYLAGHAYYMYDISVWKLKHLIILNTVMSIVGLCCSVSSTVAVNKKNNKLLNFNCKEAIVNATLAFAFAILFGVESSRISLEEFDDSWLVQSLWISCANYGLLMGAKLYQAMIVKLYIKRLIDNESHSEDEEEPAEEPKALAEVNKIGCTTNMEATTHLERKSIESLV